MTVIEKDTKLVTFINMFTVDPTNQQRLLDLLAKVTESEEQELEQRSVVS